MTPIIKYKLTGELSGDKTLSRKIKRIAARYLMFEGELYRRSVIRPLLKCVGPTDSQLILAEIHEGLCGHHMGQGLWPTKL
jgi:hypothetical protein